MEQKKGLTIWARESKMSISVNSYNIEIQKQIPGRHSLNWCKVHDTRKAYPNRCKVQDTGKAYPELMQGTWYQEGIPWSGARHKIPGRYTLNWCKIPGRHTLNWYKIPGRHTLNWGTRYQEGIHWSGARHTLNCCKVHDTRKAYPEVVV